MNTLCNAILLVATGIILLLSGSAEARTVYLKDGAILKAKSAWRSGGRVVVLVNYETEVTFPAGEVDLKKTFSRHSVHTKPHQRPRQTAPPPAETTGSEQMQE